MILLRRSRLWPSRVCCSLSSPTSPGKRRTAACVRPGRGKIGGPGCCRQRSAPQARVRQGRTCNTHNRSVNAPAESVARTVKLKDPVAHGVPLIRPVERKIRTQRRPPFRQGEVFGARRTQDCHQLLGRICGSDKTGRKLKRQDIGLRFSQEIRVVDVKHFVCRQGSIIRATSSIRPLKKAPAPTADHSEPSVKGAAS